MTHLSRSARSVLLHADRKASFGWNLLTGRTVPLRVVRRLLARGLLADDGPAVVVDGDGFAIQPERERHSYALTDAGRAAVAHLRAEDRAVLGARMAQLDVANDLLCPSSSHLGVSL